MRFSNQKIAKRRRIAVCSLRFAIISVNVYSTVALICFLKNHLTMTKSFYGNIEVSIKFHGSHRRLLSEQNPLFLEQ